MLVHAGTHRHTVTVVLTVVVFSKVSEVYAKRRNKFFSISFYDGRYELLKSFLKCEVKSL